MAEAKEIKNQVIYVSLVNAIEGGVLSGNRTLNQEKLPGAIIVRTPIGIEVEYRGALEFVPYSNIKNVKVR